MSIIGNSAYSREISMAELARSPKQIGTLIRRQRKKLGLTQGQLGERTGMRQETISLIETGNPASRLDTIQAILAALDLELQIAPRSRGRHLDALTD